MVAEYVASILAGAGFEPVQAATLAQARAHLRDRVFGLWLCDRHLPDGDGASLLAERADARHRDTPALALSAQLDEDERRALLAAGFGAALAKPCPPELLREAVARLLGRESDGVRSVPASASIDARPVLDDDAGLRVCGGDPATLAALRRLLAAELSSQSQRLEQLWSCADGDGLSAELHKLAASAAWCGASEIADAGSRLKAALGHDDATHEWLAFRAALTRLSTALTVAQVAPT